MPIGRVHTVFLVNHRFGVTTGEDFLVHLDDRDAYLRIAEKLSILEYVDTANSICPLPGSTKWKFKIKNAVNLDQRSDIGQFIGPKTFLSGRSATVDTSKASVEDLKKGQFGHRLSLYEHKESLDYFTYSTRYASRIGIRYELAVEAEQWAQPKVDPFAARVYNYFVSVYRAKTTDIRPALFEEPTSFCLIHQSFCPYTEEELQLSAKERILKTDSPEDHEVVKRIYFFNKSLSEQFPYTNSEIPQVTHDIKEMLSIGNEVPMSRLILSQAQRTLEMNKSPSTAIVEAMIAVELAVNQVVRLSKERRGVSKGKLNDFKKDIGIGYMLNIDLIIALNPVTVNEREIIGNVDRIRKIRNEVVHEGFSPSFSDATEGINAVRTLLNMLEGRSYCV